MVLAWNQSDLHHLLLLPTPRDEGKNVRRAGYTFRKFELIADSGVLLMFQANKVSARRFASTQFNGKLSFAETEHGLTC